MKRAKAEAKMNRPREKEPTKKVKAAKPKTPKTKNSARKSKPKKPEKKPNGVKLSGRGRPTTVTALGTTGTTTARGTTTLTEHLTEPGSGFAQVRRVDLVA